ncbi:MAG TPA: helix-turn-helix transcriptional regulator [Thermoanaerobaculia bacterium]|nr:helix-turn-helix transcriptional regulator [Thermoanaerobaculia bacterium]
MSYFGRVLFEWHGTPFFVTERAYGPRQRIASHVHEKPYLCVVTRGEYRERTPGATHDCRRATVVLHPAGSRHSDEFADLESRCLNVEIDPQWLGEHRFLREHAVFSDGPLPAIGLRIEREMRERDELTPLVIEGLLLEMTVAAERSTRNAMPGWLRRSMERLRDDKQECLSSTLRELATSAGVHPGHFARAFRRHIGCTVGDYLRRVRIERAIDAMNAGGVLAEVASACGFADQSHFTRTFRRVTGTTPSAYQREAKMRSGFKTR